MAVKIKAPADIPLVNELRLNIYRNIYKIDGKTVKKFLDKPIVTSRKEYEALEKKAPHYILNKKMLESIIEEFFSDYTLKRLAEQVYYKDPGETFTESYISEEELGKVKNKRGVLVPSYEVEMEFKVLPFYEGVRSLGLPFKIVGLRLV